VVAEASSKTLVLSVMAFTVELQLVAVEGIWVKELRYCRVAQGGLCCTEVKTSNMYLEQIWVEISMIQMSF